MLLNVAINDGAHHHVSLTSDASAGGSSRVTEGSADGMEQLQRRVEGELHEL